MTSHGFALHEPGMTMDGNGFLRYAQASHDARVDWILRNGQDLSVTVELWTPVYHWQPMGRALFVLELHPGPDFLHMSGNPHSAPWGYHMSLIHLDELTPGVT